MLLELDEAARANEAAPFGGVKQSGMDCEGSRSCIEDYVEITHLCIAGP